jgi:signal transduction histidine kinase
MLARLRHRFILIMMSLLTLVMLGVFGVNVFSTWQAERSRIDSALTLGLERGPGNLVRPWVGAQPLDGTLLGDSSDSSDSSDGTGGWGGIDGLGGDGRNDDYTNADNSSFVPVFVVVVQDNVIIADTNDESVFMDDELVETAVAAVSERSRDEGTLADLGLAYRRAEVDGLTRIAFTNSTGLAANTLHTALVMGLICLGALLAFFGISVLLARIVTRPVAEAWEQQQRFVADASHELKTPLTVILANNELLASSPEKTVGEQQRWVDSTQTEALHMQTLVENLLSLARSDQEQAGAASGASLQAAGTEQAPAQAVDFSSLTEKVTLQFEPLMFERQVSLETAIIDSIFVQGWQDQLERLVAILMDNACKYVDVGGRIHVRLDAAGDGRHSAILRVTNSGVPIPPESLPRIFERFYRGDESHSDTVEGYGLGLSLALNIVNAHHGTITVASAAEVGTTFTVEL